MATDYPDTRYVWRRWMTWVIQSFKYFSPDNHGFAIPGHSALHIAQHERQEGKHSMNATKTYGQTDSVALLLEFTSA